MKTSRHIAGASSQDGLLERGLWSRHPHRHASTPLATQQFADKAHRVDDGFQAAELGSTK